MKKLKAALCAAALAISALPSQAALLHFTGNITYHNDVVQVHFTLHNDATNVRVWTDSYQNGTNFDPVTALWKSDGTLLAQKDDKSDIDPNQTDYDSGFILSFLEAGDYIFTVATYANWVVSDNLSDGFRYDSETPIPLADWDQPSNHLGMGTFWSVWLDGVDQATVPQPPQEQPSQDVPEPSGLALLAAAGVSALAFRRRKTSQPA